MSLHCILKFECPKYFKEYYESIIDHVSLLFCDTFFKGKSCTFNCNSYQLS